MVRSQKPQTKRIWPVDVHFSDTKFEEPVVTGRLHITELESENPQRSLGTVDILQKRLINLTHSP